MAFTESASSRRDIETRTKKSLAIETSPSPENISKCNQQLQSPLFGILPAEIRNYIFSLALLQYEDPTQPYPENDFCYHPGHRARRVLSTELLLTCRRIWLEANHWPMEQAVQSFWFEHNRRPSWTRRNAWNDDVRFIRFMDKFSSTSCLRIKHIQVSAQMYWFERSLECSDIWDCLEDKSLSLDTFTLTIRHTDWWNWESDSPLRFDEDRIRALLRTSGASHIAEFRLELETLEWNMNQLRPILDKLRTLNNIHDPEEDAGIHWELAEPFEETIWSGPTDIDGDKLDVYSKRDKLDYRIVTVKWKRRNYLVEATEKRWREEGSLLKLTEREPPKNSNGGYRDTSQFSDEEDRDWDDDDDMDDEDDEEQDDDEDDD